MEKTIEINPADFEIADLILGLHNRWNRECDEIDAMIEQVEVGKNKNAALEQKVKDLEEELRTRPKFDQSKVQQLEADYQKLEQYCRDLKFSLDVSSGEKLTLIDKLEGVTKELAESNKLLDEKSTELCNTAFQHGEAVGSLSKVTAELKTVTVERDALLVKQGKHDNQINQQKKEVSKVKNEINGLNVELKALKAMDAKGLDKKVKNLQKRNTELLAAKTQLHTDNKAYRKENYEVKKKKDDFAAALVTYKDEYEKLEFKFAMAKATTLYKNGENVLMLMPNLLRVMVEGKEMPDMQVQLLFSNSRGVWRQVTLDHDNSLAVGTLHCDEYADKTRKLVNSCLPQMAEETQEWALSWLRKVKQQEWVVYEEDIYLFNSESELEDETANL